MKEDNNYYLIQTDTPVPTLLDIREKGIKDITSFTLLSISEEEAHDIRKEYCYDR